MSNVKLICEPFEEFEQVHPSMESRLFTYSNRMMIVLFVILQFRRIFRFKAQWRWLAEHPEMLALLGWKEVPHPTTLLRRYKQLYEVIQAFVQFVGQDASVLDERLRQENLVEDKSSFNLQVTFR
jgi:hypothetical protein